MPYYRNYRRYNSYLRNISKKPRIPKEKIINLSVNEQNKQ